MSEDTYISVFSVALRPRIGLLTWVRESQDGACNVPAFGMGSQETRNRDAPIPEPVPERATNVSVLRRSTMLNVPINHKTDPQS